MTPLLRFARPGYAVVLLALVAGLAYLVTGSAEGAFAVVVLEAVLWASLQFFKDRRAGWLKRRA